MLDIVFAPSALASILIAKLAIKKMTKKVDLDEVTGVVLYFFYLTSLRMARAALQSGAKAIGAMKQVDVKLPMKKETVTSVLDINSVYRLNGLEVILGFDRTGRPIRVDLDKYHTLIAGTTGSGKTNLVNMIIAQLVTRPYFSKEYDLYLVDLKHGKDYLNMWKPVVKGYYSLDASGTSAEAVIALKSLVETMHMQDNGKRKVVLIDEVANLTSQSTDPELKKHGFAILQRISAQLRDVGALVAATQRPHFQTIERGVTANLERKISLRVDDKKDSKLTLRFEPSVDCTQFRDGDFLLKEPGSRNREQLGRTLLMKVPKEIDVAISHLIEINSENDERLKIFRMACGTLASGDSLPGVNREMWKKASVTVPNLQTAYKNYALAGATVAKVDKRGQPNSYILGVEFSDAYKKVVEYIQMGLWEAAPETIGRENGEEQ